MGNRVVFVVFVVSAALLQSTVAWAQSTKSGSRFSGPAQIASGKSEDKGAEFTTATFGDWQLRCRKGQPADGLRPATPRTCEIVQSVIIQGQSAPFAQLAFGRPTPDIPLQFTAVLPVNFSFPSTVKFSLTADDGKPVELLWTRCMPGGCFATITTSKDLLERWREHDAAARFTFKSSNGQDVTMPFSLKGVGRALDALAAEG